MKGLGGETSRGEKSRGEKAGVNRHVAQFTVLEFKFSYPTYHVAPKDNTRVPIISVYHQNDKISSTPINPFLHYFDDLGYLVL